MLLGVAVVVMVVVVVRVEKSMWWCYCSRLHAESGRRGCSRHSKTWQYGGCVVPRKDELFLYHCQITYNMILALWTDLLCFLIINV